MLELWWDFNIPFCKNTGLVYATQRDGPQNKSNALGRTSSRAVTFLHALFGTASNSESQCAFLLFWLPILLLYHRYQMSSWKPIFKLAGKVFTILWKRPDMDREERRLKANSLDHSLADIPRTSTELTLGSKTTPKHDDPPIWHFLEDWHRNLFIGWLCRCAHSASWNRTSGSDNLK